MTINVGGKKVTAHGALPLRQKDIELRKAKDGVDEAQLQDAVKHNGLDEIAFKTDDGDLYVAVADELDIKGRLGLAKEGDRIQIGDLEGTVVFSDNELNKARLALMLAAGGVVGGVGTGAAIISATMASANVLTAIPLAIVSSLQAMIGGGAVAGTGLAAGGATAAMGGHFPEDLEAATDHVATFKPGEG